jgi:magnesium-transporting ATPase (P-type)
VAANKAFARYNEVRDAGRPLCHLDDFIESSESSRNQQEIQSQARRVVICMNDMNGKETIIDHQEQSWHALPDEEVLQQLQSSPEGLTGDEASQRLEKFGPNTLPAPEPPTLLDVIIHQFTSPLIYILLVAGAVAILIGEYTDATFIFIVILLNASIGTFQEWRAEQSAAALQSLLKIKARVRRQGKEESVEAESLVPGDIVLLESGDRVPADLRLLYVKNLEVDESFLTGESVAVSKGLKPVEADAPVSERASMTYAGSTVTSGRGVGVVIATGTQTEMGLIANTVAEAKTAKPPLVIRMEQFARNIGIIVVFASILLGFIGYLQGMDLSEVFFLAVALAVSAIPEGLPVALTVALSLATSRMAQRNVIVRRLAAVESLGSCTAIASDKTGTLTVNRQTARHIYLPGDELLAVSGEGYVPEGEVTAESGEALPDAVTAQLERFAQAAIVVNEANLRSEDGEWSYHGDAVDVALLTLGYKLGLDPEAIRSEAETISELPFESDRRYSAKAYRAGNGLQVAAKGAAEAILLFCQEMLTREGEVPIDTEAIEQEVLNLTAKGYRVLAVAHTAIDGEAPAELDEEEMPPLTLVGLVAFIDPLRPEATEAVDRCRAAGVEVMMITGDHPATALAIARDLHIADSEDDIITGSDLDELGSPDSDTYRDAINSTHVFARVTPLQKLHIVENLIEGGHFVAVTGDGVNDAPALRRANIGVAMGSGTDIAKDTASMIVTNDNFASIVAGIEEGRYAYDNVRKVTYLLISTGAAEVLLIALALLFGLPLPLLAVQILWLNLVTNGIQDVALAFEGGEPGAMKRRPRRPTEGIFNRLMVTQTVTSGAVMGLVVFGVWYWLLSNGWEETAARNLVLLLMVLFQNFHAFNCRSEHESAFRVPFRRNPVLVIGVLAAQGIHLLAMQLPFMQVVLDVAPVSSQEWLVLLLLASTILVTMELFKFFKRKVETS